MNFLSDHDTLPIGTTSRLGKFAYSLALPACLVIYPVIDIPTHHEPIAAHAQDGFSSYTSTIDALFAQYRNPLLPFLTTDVDYAITLTKPTRNVKKFRMAIVRKARPIQLVESNEEIQVLIGVEHV